MKVVRRRPYVRFARTSWPLSASAGILGTALSAPITAFGSLGIGAVSITRTAKELSLRAADIRAFPVAERDSIRRIWSHGGKSLCLRPTTLYGEHGFTFFAKALGDVEALYDNWLASSGLWSGALRNHSGSSRFVLGEIPTALTTKISQTR